MMMMIMLDDYDNNQYPRICLAHNDDDDYDDDYDNNQYPPLCLAHNGTDGR